MPSTEPPDGYAIECCVKRFCQELKYLGVDSAVVGCAWDDTNEVTLGNGCGRKSHRKRVKAILREAASSVLDDRGAPHPDDGKLSPVFMLEGLAAKATG